LPQQWQESCTNISYIPVVSGIDSDWNGRRGLVHKAVMEDYSDLSGHEIYACGSPAMIDAARMEFIALGANPDQFYYDAFSPSS
jgi:NAD(P)H-flavin reductase